MFEYFILLFSVAVGFLLGGALAVHRRKKKYHDHHTPHNP